MTTWSCCRVRLLRLGKYQLPAACPPQVQGLQAWRLAFGGDMRRGKRWPATSTAPRVPGTRSRGLTWSEHGVSRALYQRAGRTRLPSRGSIGHLPQVFPPRGLRAKPRPHWHQGSQLHALDQIGFGRVSSDSAYASTCQLAQSQTAALRRILHGEVLCSMNGTRGCTFTLRRRYAMPRIV